ncbi:alpha-ketoacid dehydrogenase subunit beta [Kroppenstedtia eburnea]|uniref:Pyruvate dehydrogenase E1 component beta subunit n=1 Tax=Kroppenstedtia eburnea TaxID=714067 RepID=A0A1N7NLG2_9BACL|nr:alpha-ketoacid dehydrogenase subunit beta [Kroppenstedtia eburnea]EGK08915.1 pyruvate dehydrogenase complex E1 component beta subunit [Desmospora sp. 8437]QKI81008.1 alpha-ketoacid dehydrogenase subunit beta [Kroppenstedtia eburnea]SIS99100.1 pyruvate dehydrogenase E1 component beta subunit [Kroppenstedtia eburnea]
MATMTLIKAINDAMRVEMERDENVVVLGEDVGVNGGVFRATADLYQTFGEKRSFDTPLAESAIIGTAIGLASQGFRPVPEIQFAGFVYECMDQISTQAARLRMRSGGRFNVPITIRVPYGGGVKTPEMHSDSLEALFLHSPGVKVVVPSNPYDAKGLLISAIRDDDPVIFYEPMKLYRSVKAEVPEEAYTVPLGKAHVVKEGTDVTLIAYGAMVPLCEKAAEQAEKERGIQVEVIDLRTISPFDLDTIIQSVQKTHRAVVVHEAAQTGGVGAELSARIHEEAILSLEAPVVRVTGFDTPYPLTAIEDEWLPTVERVCAGIYKTLDF